MANSVCTFSIYEIYFIFKMHFMYAEYIWILIF
jgi:hypothetical protein